MQPTYHTAPFQVTLLGASCPHDPARSFGQEIISLLNRVWPQVKSRNIPNTGLNYAVYDEGRVFAGIEASVTNPAELGLDSRTLCLQPYAEWLHIGPYSKLGAACAELNKAVKLRGLQPCWPLVEVYGHHDPDESKLETRILQAYMIP